MVANPRTECLRRAAWYLTRIRALQHEMASKPNLDGDDVEQCQAMLREIRAGFRADQRTPARGQILSQIENSFRTMVTQADAALRIPAGSRPAGRWRALLNECESHIDRFATENGPSSTAN